MSPDPINDPTSKKARAEDRAGHWTWQETFYSIVKDSVVGQSLHYASSHKIFKYQEDREDFIVPRRFRRDADTQAKLDARQRRIQGQKSLASRFKASSGEEKPIRIDGVKRDMGEKGQRNKEVAEAVDRERSKQDTIRDGYPVRIAPPRMSTTDLEAQVLHERAHPNGSNDDHARRMSNGSDSEATQIEDDGVDGRPYREDEEGLGMKDDEDPNIVTWYGEHDKENPLNWSPFKKAFVTFSICLITISVYMGSSIVSPGTTEADAYFGTSKIVGTLGLSMFVAGYGIGPLFLSPITEIPSIGRTWPYIISLAVFCILQAPTLVVTNFGGYLALRFFAGLAGSAPLATGGASISDCYGPKTRPYAMGLWGLSASLGPSLGPIISSFAVAANGFRWAFWIMLWLSGASLLFLIFFLPETSAINILVRRAKRLRRVTGNPDLKSEGEIEQANMTTSEIVQMSLVRPITLTFTQPIILALNLYIGFIYSVLYAFFEVYPLVFNEMYGFPLSTGGLPFLGLSIGSFVGYIGYCFWQNYYWNPKFDQRGGNLEPEYRLHPALLGAFCIPICLFCFGWSAGRTHWMAPICFSVLFGVGMFTLFQGILNYLPDTYPKYAASVLASNDFVRAAFGAAMPVVATPLFANLGVDYGCTLLGGISVLFIPIPFLLIHYGARIRMKSDQAEVVPGEEDRKPAF